MKNAKIRIVLSPFLLLSIMRGLEGMPLKDDSPWSDGNPAFASIELPDGPNPIREFSEMSVMPPNDDGSLVQKILELAESDSTGLQVPDGFRVSLRDKDQLYSPYFFKKYFPNTLTHQQVHSGRSNWKRNGELYSPYFMKRGYHRPGFKQQKEIVYPANMLQ